MNTALVAFRFVHFASAMMLFGGGLFRLSLRKHLPTLALARTDFRLRWIFAAAASLAVASGIGWLLAVAGQMTDRPFADIDWPTMQSVLFQTWFGTNWLWRMAVGLIVLVMALRNRFVSTEMVLGAALVFLAGLAVTGHLGAREDFVGGVERASDAVHLLGAGTWIGGLAVLALALNEQRAAASDIVYRFSRLTFVAVAAMLVSGIANACFLLPSISALWTSDYGIVLASKIALVAVMLTFAVFNRLVLTPKLANDARASTTLLRNAIVEISLGIVVIAAAALLGTLAPPAMAM